MKIVYLPLDERPCNYHFAGRIAEGSGVQVLKPSMQVLGDKKQPADFDGIKEFLLSNAPDADSYVLSLDMLLYGGIVPSRLHHLSEDALCQRLSVVARIKEINPKAKIYAFALIMRCPKYSSADEEPDYYGDCGREIFLSGQIKHKLQLGHMEKDEAEALLTGYRNVIGQNLQDFETRRAVNRNLLLKAVEMLHQSIDFLIIPQDDSAEYGYTSMDREAIKAEIRRRGLEDVAMYPGADEVGMTLLARAVCENRGVTPKIYCEFAHENVPNVIPLYEDRPLGATLPFQINSAGCTACDRYADADIILYLNYPAHSPVEVFEEKSAGYDERHLATFTESIMKSVQTGKVTALADGAFCNGGDKEFLRALNERMDILSLSAYAGWNTSSNTLGTVICQAVFVSLFGDSAHQKRFLAERLYEDVGYCGYVRMYVTQNFLPSLGYDYFNAGEAAGEVADLVRKELASFMDAHFPNVAKAYDICTCQMPWRRMFEVDLALTEKV
ncbi:MAG: DUF4127 family protein [Ruminococcaceae bacterium]|nr:DUF4127 family protein [Oscillospiraceae bacterium]